MNSRLSAERIQQQMTFMNDANERELALEQVILSTANEETRPISASSSEALEIALKKKQADKEAEQKLNDRAIIVGYSNDLATISDLKENTFTPQPTAPLFDYDPEAEGEVIPVRMPPGTPSIILDSLHGDIHPIETHKTAKFSTQYAQFKLFGKTLDNMLTQEATHVGKLLLYGDAKDREDALILIRKKPILLCLEIIIGQAKGTILQIAAIMGDFNLRPGIVDERSKGAVERIIATGLLSPEEAKEQLKCVTSEEAKLANDARIKRYVALFRNFIQQIRDDEIITTQGDRYYTCKGMPYGPDQTYFDAVKRIVNNFHKRLLEERSKEVSSGFAFYLTILTHALQLCNSERLSGIRNYVIFKNGIGKLQSLLSLPDLRVLQHGIYNLIKKEIIPPYIKVNLNSKPLSELGNSAMSNPYGGTEYSNLEIRQINEYIELFHALRSNKEEALANVLMQLDNPNQYKRSP